MTKKKVVFIVIAVIIVGAIIFWRYQAAQIKNGQIKTANVEQKTLVNQITSSGKTEAKESVDLHFQTYGRLAWVGVEEGDRVQAYQAIASLDVQELQKNFIKALRDYSKERNDFEEDRRDTYKDKPVTDTIKRILEKNQWDLEKAVIDVEIKDIALKLATLTTPIAGIVTRIDTPVAGVNVVATDTFTIVNPDTIVFSANVDEVDIGKIKEGLTAEIDLDAYPDSTVSGTVTKVALTAETTSGGATVFPVEISFDSTEIIRVGLNGDVSIIISEYPNTIIAPSEAVLETADGQKYVIKKQGKKFIKVNITVGIITEDKIQIVSGLIPGDEVVVEGFGYLPKN